MDKKIVFILVLLMLFAGCSVPFKKSPTGTTTEPTPSPSPEVSPTQSPYPGSPFLYISAWFAPYDATRAYNSFSGQVQNMDEINPVWYNLNPEYFATAAESFTTTFLKQPEIMSLAPAHGVKVLPTVQNFGKTGFDTTVLSKILPDPTLRARHIQEILDLVKINGYDGIDLDYEGLPASLRDAYSVFCAALGQALAKEGKELSITVHAKTSADATWNGPGAQDWSALALSATTFKVMVYDYHWAAFHPGPISPVDWLRAILDYARTVPEVRGKLIVGLPFYGIDWPATGAGREVMYLDVVEMMKQHTVLNANRVDFEHTHPYCNGFQDNVELHFDYKTAEGILHTVYFQDRTSLAERMKLIGEYRDIVHGVAFWRLGGEDLGNWVELAGYR